MDNPLKSIPESGDQLSSQPPRLLSEIAYERIKDAIRNSDLEPGQPLSETKLSKLLGISRTPVREAIQQLAQEGLVHIIPGRAVTVASLSVQEVLNAVHIRAILEPEVVRLAAASMTAEGLERLWLALHEMEEAIEDEDRTTWAKADTRFHEILSAACPNKLLGDMAIQVRDRVSYLSADSQTSHDRMLACTNEHRQIVEAIAAGDPQAAEGAMREHIDKLRESFFRRLTHT
jgi:DNA-binding GntR family transcriptional regulator